MENTGNVLVEVLVGKDPTQQTKLDKLLAREPSLCANVVSAASIACCKAGAKQTLVPVFDHIGTMCSNSEGAIPSIAFSIINGGHLSASSLWVQVRTKKMSFCGITNACVLIRRFDVASKYFRNDASGQKFFSPRFRPKPRFLRYTLNPEKQPQLYVHETNGRMPVLTTPGMAFSVCFFPPKFCTPSTC